jgi:hypothetical protein
LPEGLAADWALDAASSLQLSLSATRNTPGPRPDPEADDSTSAGERTPRRTGRRAADDGEPPPLDLSLEVVDGGGRSARVSLSAYGPVRRPLEIRIRRRQDQEAAQTWELVLQTLVVPLADFTAAAPDLELADLRAVRLVFDQSVAGEVVVDEIGFSHLDPAYWTARVR